MHSGEILKLNTMLFTCSSNVTPCTLQDALLDIPNRTYSNDEHLDSVLVINLCIAGAYF